MRNLILVCGLLNPPSEMYAVRDIMLQSYPKFIILIESEKEFFDIYHRYIKKNFLYDFVEDLIEPHQEKGLRIDTEVHDYETIQVDRICGKNELEIIEKIIVY